MQLPAKGAIDTTYQVAEKGDLAARQHYRPSNHCRPRLQGGGVAYYQASAHANAYAYALPSQSRYRTTCFTVREALAHALQPSQPHSPTRHPSTPLYYPCSVNAHVYPPDISNARAPGLPGALLGTSSPLSSPMHWSKRGEGAGFSLVPMRRPSSAHSKHVPATCATAGAISACRSTHSARAGSIQPSAAHVYHTWHKHCARAGVLQRIPCCIIIIKVCVWQGGQRGGRLCTCAFATLQLTQTLPTQSSIQDHLLYSLSSAAQLALLPQQSKLQCIDCSSPPCTSPGVSTARARGLHVYLFAAPSPVFSIRRMERKDALYFCSCNTCICSCNTAATLITATGSPEFSHPPASCLLAHFAMQPSLTMVYGCLRAFTRLQGGAQCSALSSTCALQETMLW